MAIYLPIITELKSDGIDKAKKEFKSLEGAGAKASYAVKKAAVPAAAVPRKLRRVASEGLRRFSVIFFWLWPISVVMWLAPFCG